MAYQYDEEAAEKFEKYGVDWHHYPVETVMSFLKKRAAGAGAVTENGSEFELMLDVGCGGGKSTRPFAPYFRSIVGFDVSKEMIEKAKQINTTENITYSVAPGESMPAKNETVDLIICVFAAHHLDIPKFVSECRRVLKQQGCVAIYGFEDIEMYPTTPRADIQRLNGVPLLQKHIRVPTRQYYLARNHLEETGFNRFETIFTMIDGMHKTRDDSLTFERSCSLSRYLQGLRAVPRPESFYSSFDSDIVEMFEKEVKRFWRMSGEKNEDIQLKIRSSVFIIFLTK